MFIPAIVGRGNTEISANSDVPKTIFFISQPPLSSIAMSFFSHRYLEDHIHSILTAPREREDCFVVRCLIEKQVLRQMPNGNSDAIYHTDFIEQKYNQAEP